MVQLCLYIIFLSLSYSHSFEFLGTLIGNADVKTKIDFDSRLSSASNTNYLGAKLDQYRSQTSVYVPIYQEGGEAAGFSTDVQAVHFHGYNFETDARNDMKNSFEAYQFGTFYRKKLENDRAVAYYVNFSTRSNRPFDRAADNSVDIFAIYRIQKTLTTDLVFLIAYTNNRTVLSGIPVPGFAYVWNPKPELFSVIGIPANYILYVPMDNLVISATAILPVIFKFDVNYRFWGPLLAYAGWDVDHHYYFASDRVDDNDKIILDEKGINAGIKMLFSRTSYITLGANYDYYNTIFESKSYYGKRNWAIDIDPHWNLDLKATFSF